MSTLLRRAVSLCTLLLASLASAQDTVVYLVPREAREALVDLRATVQHGSAERPFTAELTADQVAELRRQGFRPVPLRADPADAPLEGTGYSSYGEMRADFLAYAAAYPAIARFEVLGTSVQGREIFGLKISGNAQVEEDEPEVVFWGSIHGNEFASGEVTYQYALDLCDGYGVDPNVTEAVDQNEIWCIPLLNPDGHEAGTRNNANNVDLNRDYGFQWDGWGSSPAPHSQPETRAVREFCLANNITLSATMHCSGDVFLYPWGFSPNAAPDAGLIQQVGALYATAASYTLVSSWVSYETHGELLDYVYGSHGGLCYTTEMSNLYGAFPTTYARNEAGMNAFCAIAGAGLHGLVTDAQTGQPLQAAVWVSGNDVPAYTDPELGDLHRLLAPGMVDVTVWANGYAPQTVTGVVVPPPSQPPGTFQVTLQPDGNEHAFLVTAVDQRDPGNEYNNTSAPASALGPLDGQACSLGRNGFIVLDLGPGKGIADGPGADFTVTEALLPSDTTSEEYAVYAGDAYTQNTPIGLGVGTTSFDLSGTGLQSTRFLRIVDRSNADPDEPLAGMDLDGVTVRNGFGPPTGTFVRKSPGIVHPGT